MSTKQNETTWKRGPSICIGWGNAEAREFCRQFLAGWLREIFSDLHIIMMPYSPEEVESAELRFAVFVLTRGSSGGDWLATLVCSSSVWGTGIWRDLNSPGRSHVD